MAGFLLKYQTGFPPVFQLLYVNYFHSLLVGARGWPRAKSERGETARNGVSDVEVIVQGSEIRCPPVLYTNVCDIVISVRITACTWEKKKRTPAFESKSNPPGSAPISRRRKRIIL